MATEDTDTEEGGQTDDTGDTGSDESEDTPADGNRQEAATDKQPGARDKRRSNRFREEKEARTRAEQELGELKGRYSGLEQQFNELRTQIARDRQQAQQSNASTETKGKITSLRQQARNFLVQAAQQKDVAEHDRLLAKHDELMDEADDLRADMREGSRWDKRKGEIAGQMPDTSTMGEVMYFTSKYPWLESNTKAQKMARAHFDELVESGKRQANRATMEEAVTWAAKTLGIGGRSAPGDRSRQVYTGTGQRDGDMDNSDPSGSLTVEDVKNNLAFKRMAQLTFNQDEPEVAYQKWATMQNKANKNGVGAR